MKPLTIVLVAFLSGVSIPSVCGPDTRPNARPNASPQAPFTELIPEIADYLVLACDESVDMELLLEQLDELNQNPVPIYPVEMNEYNRLFWLSSFQILSLAEYVQAHGPPVSVYELAYIPGFNLSLVRTLTPFVTFTEQKRPGSPDASNVVRQRVVAGYQRLLETQKGYSLPGSSFLGSPDKWYLRYQVQKGTAFTFGFLSEKDPGEPFFRRSNPKGFDFYSGYGMWQPDGLVKTVVIGDFKADFGSGLVLSSARSFGKASMISRPARVPYGLRGYSSSSESGFFRGAGVVLQSGRLEVSLFASHQDRDAVMSEDGDIGVRSMVLSGLHATSTDLQHRNMLTEQDAGLNISWQTDRLRVAVTGLGIRYSLPLLRGAEPYQLYEFSGKEALMGSVGYTYVSGQWLAFGEQSLSQSGACAWLHGLQIRLGSSAHATVAYRYYAPSYYAPYSNTLSEGSATSNERGWFMGCAFPLGKRWTVTLYSDFYSFPWFRSNVSAPSQGYEFLLRMEYVFTRQSSISWQWREEYKMTNGTTSAWRLLLVHEIVKGVRSRSQLECKYFRKTGVLSRGFYFGQDISVKHRIVPLDWTFRLAVFDTYDYDSRIYAYENDMLYAFTVPAFFDRGIRAYIQVKYSPHRNCDVRIKWSRTVYPDKETIGSGLGAINKNTRTEIRVQLLFRFRSFSIQSRKPT